jgi:Protein of unknown function (DUF429)
VRTIGVDLAAEPTGTAIASIEWLPEQATVSGLVIGADDGQVIDAVLGADKAGIDCPLGWPMSFVESSRHIAMVMSASLRTSIAADGGARWPTVPRTRPSAS